MAVDCDDGSDERNCSSVEFDSSRYNKDDPPVVSDNKTAVEISTVFESVRRC